MNNTFLIAIALTSTLALAGCGNKLDNKTAKQVLLEAQEPVRNTDLVVMNWPASQIAEKRPLLDVYKKAKLIKSIDASAEPPRIKLNIIAIGQKWSKYVNSEFKSERDGGNNATIYNYTTRVGEILRIDTKPVDHLCDAMVEYKYEAFDFAPWGKKIASVKKDGTTVYEACFIKYDKDWGVKDWRKIPRRKRR